jgi:FtsP/CotA-like multicopper oxidase with cupredoxin domain
MQSNKSTSMGDWPNKELARFLSPPDGMHDQSRYQSPPVTPFKDPLFVPPAATPVPELVPPLDPEAHQHFKEFPPRVFYITEPKEFLWQFHSDWGKVSWSWGPNGTTPGPTIHARYGEPIGMRMVNTLPIVFNSNLSFSQPYVATHLHNGHVASESDGFTMDFAEPGMTWDHHYTNFPSTNFDPDTGELFYDDREKLTTLWYHDHMMDFTAANVYAGLVGLFLLFDEQDSGNENDPNPGAWRLPSGEFDIPLLLQDPAFDENFQLVYPFAETMGLIGDRFTVNRIIQPHFKVKRRKYRFRLLDGGPSRWYQVFLNAPRIGQDGMEEENLQRFIVISCDGNILPEPVEAESVLQAVGQRHDLIIDFSQFQSGDHLYLENRLQQLNPATPRGGLLTDPEQIREHRLMRFDVVGDEVEDPSRVPDFFRPFPPIHHDEVKRERVWDFDMDAGAMTVNGRSFDSERIDAGIEINTAEMWTYRNLSSFWSHPIHNHVSEWLVTDVDDIPQEPDMIQISGIVHGPEDMQRVFTKTESDGGDYQIGTNVLRGTFAGSIRRDIANLWFNTSVRLFYRFHDFLGRYMLHCHNVVHEDNAMMARWDIMPEGQGFEGSKTVHEVYGAPHLPVHVQASHPHVEKVHGSHTTRPGGVPGLTIKTGLQPPLHHDDEH